jgi:choline dehydrogenase
MAGLGYDIAVVGGGAAGCVMAARLAESGIGAVILLEAGPDLRDATPPELLDAWHLARPPDWGFASEPANGEQSRPLRRGRLLGGTSWLTRFAMRCSPHDFDEWQARGNADWGFDQVLPALRRLESDRDFGDRPWHGRDGPIPITRYTDVEPTEAHAAVVAAARNAGLPSVEDHNEPGAVGVGRMPMSSRDGVRVTTTAYLADAASHPNLVIRPDAHVAEVVFNRRRATGVKLVDGTVVQAALVVLCAGTYGSPPILLRSGIGPAGDLRALGIPVRVALPGVGRNLADHPGTEMDAGYAGPARTAPLLHSVATFHSRTAASAAPDLMLWFSDPDAPANPPQMTIDVVLLKPEARGTVGLWSTDPTEAPRIVLPRPGGLDLDRLAEGYERALEIVHDPALRAVCAGPTPVRPKSRADLRETVRGGTYSLPHVVGTCSMGASSDGGAVVDESGRVHGVRGLYVADASVVPTPPSGYPHLLAIMVAERIAESIATP